MDNEKNDTKRCEQKLNGHKVGMASLYSYFHQMVFFFTAQCEYLLGDKAIEEGKQRQQDGYQQHIRRIPVYITVPMAIFRGVNAAPGGVAQVSGVNGQAGFSSFPLLTRTR